MAAADLTIGRLSKASGCKVPTIRYYEQIGLMPAPARSEGNQRLYERSHLERLTFIRHARDLGFTLDDIRDLLLLSEHPEAPCDRADEIARRHLVSVRDRMARLGQLATELERMIGCCDGPSVADCRVIGSLLDQDWTVSGGQEGRDSVNHARKASASMGRAK